MTTKVLTGSYAAGYEVIFPTTTLSIAASGYVGGNGVYTPAGATDSYRVVNDGTVRGNSNAMSLGEGGTIVNGAAGDITALIDGYGGGVAIRYNTNVTGTVVNYGTIASAEIKFGAAVVLDNGGQVTNGSSLDVGAIIDGSFGVLCYNGDGNRGTVTNFGTIVGYVARAAVYLDGGGVVSKAGAGALIEGGSGVFAKAGSLNHVTNVGTILGTSSAGQNAGVWLNTGGTVVNGSATNTSALIRGAAYGVQLSSGAGTVFNYGRVFGGADDGVFVKASGLVMNGSAADTTALIGGTTGVYGQFVDLDNFGTISGGQSGPAGLYPGDTGVRLAGVGELFNGTTADKTARIQGYNGVALIDGLAAFNYGTIEGTGGYGAYISQDSYIINQAGAVIEGWTGVTAALGGHLINRGTVVGEGGVAVQLSGNSTLAVSAGCAFEGAVLGGNGTLLLASGTGTLSGVGAGAVTVSGSMATTTFTSFAALDLATGAKFILSGDGMVSAGDSLEVLGSLGVAGTLTASGTLVSLGTIGGAGTLIVNAGVTTLDNSFLTIGHVSQEGTVNVFATALTTASVWNQSVGALTVGAGDRINFTGKGDIFSGTLTGAGTIDFTGGTDALTGTTMSATAMIVNGAAVTLSGTIDLSTTLTIESPAVTIALAGVSLTGGGTVYLNEAATSVIVGATPSASLTNVDDIIKGAGQLGDGKLRLVNDATIDGDLTSALTINTGTSTLTNAKLIENTNTGGLTITGPVANTGTLSVSKGTLTVDGAVSGAGMVRITGGVAHFASTFTENVDFASTTGVLELARSQTYTGQITGLSKTGASSLDLLDIAFVSGTTTAMFSGTTKSGTLTVTDGTHTAKITLEGDYVGHTFTTSSDGQGGTTIVDPAIPLAGGGHSLPLVTAMAGFGTAPPPSTRLASALLAETLSLAAPRLSMA